MRKSSCVLAGSDCMRAKIAVGLLMSQLFVFCAFADTQVIGSSGDAYIHYEKATGTWKLGTAAAEKTVQLSSEGKLELRSLVNKGTGTDWNGSKNELFSFTADGIRYTGASGYDLVRHTATTNHDGSLTLSIVLNKNEICPTVTFTVFPFSSVTRHRLFIKNNSTKAVEIKNVCSYEGVIAPSSPEALTAVKVSRYPGRIQERMYPVSSNPLETQSLSRGAGGDIPLFSFFDTARKEGIFVGSEHIAANTLRTSRRNDNNVGITVSNAYVKTLQSGQEADSAGVLTGFYTGTSPLDETGAAVKAWLDQYSVSKNNACLFHYNNWYEGRQKGARESVLKPLVDSCAELGLEAFIIDDGWFDLKGNWNPDPEKWPNGLRGFSDYVRSKGMLFGVWMPFHQTHIDSANFREEWCTPGPKKGQLDPEGRPLEGYRYLNYAKPEVVEWMKQYFDRKIVEYKLDWIKLDWGFFSYIPGDPDAIFEQVKGFYELLRHLKQRHPGLIVEMCNGGGNLMSLGEMAYCDSYWLQDGINHQIFTKDVESYRMNLDHFASMFPASRGVRWTPSGERYNIRSVMLGCPGISKSLKKWDEKEKAIAKRHVSLFKELRKEGVINASPIRLCDEPNVKNWDAMQRVNPGQTEAVIFAFRGPDNKQNERLLKPQKLLADKTYFICSEDGNVTAGSRTGADIMSKGIMLALEPRGSEIIYLSVSRKTVPGNDYPAPAEVNRPDK